MMAYRPGGSCVNIVLAMPRFALIAVPIRRPLSGMSPRCPTLAMALETSGIVVKRDQDLAAGRTNAIDRES